MNERGAKPKVRLIELESEIQAVDCSSNIFSKGFLRYVHVTETLVPVM